MPAYMLPMCPDMRDGLLDSSLLRKEKGDELSVGDDGVAIVVGLSGVCLMFSLVGGGGWRVIC